MKISFCVPIFNKEAFLADSIESILAQTHKDIEIVLFDDKSSDGCQYICTHYVTEYPDKVKYYRNDFRMGVAFARNSAWSKATGDVICVHDADDLSINKRAELVSDYFKNNLDVDIVYGHALIIDSLGRERGMVRAEDFQINILKKNNYIQHPTVAYRTNIGVKYRDDLKYIDDWYFYLDCVVAQKKFGRINEVLACYRPLQDGLTLSKGFDSKSKERLKQTLRDEFSDLNDDMSAQLFNKDCSQYDRVKKIVDEVVKESSVLDIGCNGGGILQYLKDKKDCKVEGIETARNLVDIAESKGIKVYKTDIRNFSTKNRYDYVLLTDILEHYNRKDMAHILLSAAKLINKFGKLIITVPHRHGIYNSQINADHLEDYGIEDIVFVLKEMVIKQEFVYTESYSVPTWEFITCTN
jgi:glycosyltransferase involved in cell wall biosynthesis